MTRLDTDLVFGCSGDKKGKVRAPVHWFCASPPGQPTPPSECESGAHFARNTCESLLRTGDALVDKDLYIDATVLGSPFRSFIRC